MTERKNRRGAVAALNIQISAGTHQLLKQRAAGGPKRMWRLVEEALAENLERRGSADRTDREAAVAVLNVEIDGQIKQQTNILAAINNKALRYEVEDALIEYLTK